ncbi:MAG: hypothetical protein PQJ58_01975 [Spirochaetales bacterium]|nr:hypothetical protein [Spirochaetales bacterium]
MKKIFFSIFIAALFMGCASTASTVAGQVGNIEVLYSAPEKDYEELGLVTTQTGQTIFHKKSADDIIMKLSEEAAAMGADAIIIRTVKEGKLGFKGDGLSTGYDRGYGEALAIRFTESDL